MVGDKTTTVIFMGDIWKPATQWDSRYLWMPVRRSATENCGCPSRDPWTLNIKTGEAVIAATNSTTGN